MPLTGKYNFKGIKEAGAKALKLALASVSWGAWILKFGFMGPFIDICFEALSNWLANRGLILINIGGYWVEGEFDQPGFDKAMEDGINRVIRAQGRELTQEEIDAIDNPVIKAADKFIPYSRPK